MPDQKQTPRRKAIRLKPSLAPNFVLVVGTDHVLDGFQSSDDCEELMRTFFKQLELPYPRPFVCASAREPVKEGVPGQKTRIPSHTADGYGQPFVLKPELMDQAQIACAGDCKNVMSRAFIRFVEDGTPLRDSRKYFRELSGLTVNDRRSAILELHGILLENANEFGTYVEVRLTGPAAATWSDTMQDEFSGLFAELSDDIDLE